MMMKEKTLFVVVMFKNFISKISVHCLCLLLLYCFCQCLVNNYNQNFLPCCVITSGVPWVDGHWVNLDCDGLVGGF